MPSPKKEERERRAKIAENGMKFCPGCKQDMDRDKFYKSSSRKDGIDSICRQCRSGYNKRRQQSGDFKKYCHEYCCSDRGKEVHRRYVTSELGRNTTRKYHREHKTDGPKGVAMTAVYRAIVNGKLAHPSTLACKYCGRTAEHYHHWSYLPEHRLDVVPVCARCHKAIHSDPTPAQT